MDVLTRLMAGIDDESSVETLASSFNDRASALNADGSPEALAWSAVYSALALTAESALIQRRCGISL